jgi:hypothetical protein
MPFHFHRGRSLCALALALLIPFGMAGCNRNAAKQARVKADFEAFRLAILERHADQISLYLPQNVGDYLARLKGDPSMPANAPYGAPSVNLLLRTALDQKVDPALRAHLNLQLLLQRLSDRGLLDCHEIRGLSIGRVSIAGDRATAELYFDNNLLPLRLPLVKQAGLWKVDLVAMIPYAEVLMRLDRAITGKTESQQVAQIVHPLPAL